MVANDNEWISVKTKLFGVAPPILKADYRVVDLPVSFPDDPSPPYKPEPSAFAPTPKRPILVNVLTDIPQNVSASSGLSPDFATEVKGPVSMQFLQAQVGILDTQIQAMTQQIQSL